MKQSTKKRAGSKDALTLLAEDHKAVDKIFKQFEKLKKDGGDAEKAALVRSVCAALTVHATIEEDIFYPALYDAADAEDLLDEAEVEHATIKDLVSRLEEMMPTDELYDATVLVLGEYVRHHVKEEEGEIFPKAKKAKMDLAALGERLMERKRSLDGETAAAAAAE
ncbi:MAG: hemerythrin domain-containing protein [Dongiaceae bacterium]